MSGPYSPKETIPERLFRLKRVRSFLETIFSGACIGELRINDVIDDLTSIIQELEKVQDES